MFTDPLGLPLRLSGSYSIGRLQLSSLTLFREQEGTYQFSIHKEPDICRGIQRSWWCPGFFEFPEGNDSWTLWYLQHPIAISGAVKRLKSIFPVHWQIPPWLAQTLVSQATLAVVALRRLLDYGGQQILIKKTSKHGQIVHGLTKLDASSADPAQNPVLDHKTSDDGIEIIHWKPLMSYRIMRIQRWTRKWTYSCLFRDVSGRITRSRKPSLKPAVLIILIIQKDPLLHNTPQCSLSATLVLSLDTLHCYPGAPPRPYIHIRMCVFPDISPYNKLLPCQTLDPC